MTRLVTTEEDRSLASLSELDAAIRAGRPEAVARLSGIVAQRRDQPGDHARWGRLCEAAGEAGLALTEYQLALRDDPEDVVALSRLATLYEERGDADKAIESAERWIKTAPGDSEAMGRLLELLLDADRFERAREVIDVDEIARLLISGYIDQAAAAAGIQPGEDIVAETYLAGVARFDKSEQAGEVEPVRPVSEPQLFEVPFGAQAGEADIESALKHLLVHGQVAGNGTRVLHNLRQGQEAEPVLYVADHGAFRHTVAFIEQGQQSLAEVVVSQ